METNANPSYESAPHFWKHVQKTDTCWLWTGRKNADGYGLVTHNGKQVAAHRLSYELHWSVIPKSYIVRHTCDNPGCVNPHHLVFGTSKQNSEDMAARGRSNKGKALKRIPDFVKSNIAVEYDLGNTTRARLSKKYGVNLRTLSRIIKASREGRLSPLRPETADLSDIKLEIKKNLQKLIDLIDQL